jgi:hypothetical protein
LLSAAETAAGDDDATFQSGMDSMDECKTKSSHKIEFNILAKLLRNYKTRIKIKHTFTKEAIFTFLTENDDECATAADLYGCNKEKSPSLTDAVISTVKSSSPPSSDVKCLHYS